MIFKDVSLLRVLWEHKAKDSYKKAIEEALASNPYV